MCGRCVWGTGGSATPVVGGGLVWGSESGDPSLSLANRVWGTELGTSDSGVGCEEMREWNGTAREKEAKKKGGKRGLGGEERVAPVWELWGRLDGNARQPRTRRWHRRGSHLSDFGEMHACESDARESHSTLAG